jgi:hypothetical protein
LEAIMNRRTVLQAPLVAAVANAIPSFAHTAAPMPGELLPNRPHDFDFLVGKWRVKHRRLKGRLVGSTHWEEFDGTSQLWLTMGGFGTFDDNVINLPAGTYGNLAGGQYRASTLRGYDPKEKLWSIWWLDARMPQGPLDPPVRGRFENGVGTFTTPDVNNGKPVITRFIWSETTTGAPKWEQAMSPDGGKTWETNWIMHFTRAE